MKVSGQLHSPATLPPWKPLLLLVSTGNEHGWPHSRSERYGEEKNLLLPGIEPKPLSPQPRRFIGYIIQIVLFYLCMYDLFNNSAVSNNTVLQALTNNELERKWKKTVMA
jgi:hypothetical protein